MYNTCTQGKQKFQLPGELCSCDAITMGDINFIYKVIYMRPGSTMKSYLFQKINPHMFKDPVEIMKNIDRVTTYIREQHPNQITLCSYHAAEGMNYYICGEDVF